VVVTVQHPGREPELLAIGLPGDREVDLKRLNAALAPATAVLFDGFDSRPDLVKGYIGPQGIKIRYLTDPRVAPGTAWLTGANEPGRHATDVVCGRDFTPDGTIEAAEVRPGDPCPACGDGSLTMRRGIEIGHIFQLGRRYTDAFKVDVLGADGKPSRPTMGCYGIGLSRAVASVAEQHHDDRGLTWPASIAPADVHIVAAGKDGQIEAALTLAGALSRAGLRVLVDDRPNVSAGVKFTDAELIGISRCIVVGRRLSEGYVEVRDRRTQDRTEVPLADVAGVIAAELG
jgi:prolyl-tRNA synthetase